MRRFTLFSLIGFLIMAMPGMGFLLENPSAYAEDGWKAEFDHVCSMTRDAMGLPVDDLKELVRKCDALKPRIEHLSGTEKKVYLRRLEMCRALYLFVLEEKEGQ